MRHVDDHARQSVRGAALAPEEELPVKAIDASEKATAAVAPEDVPPVLVVAHLPHASPAASSPST